MWKAGRYVAQPFASRLPAVLRRRPRGAPESAASQPLLTDYLHRRLPTEQRATVVSLTTLVYAAVMMSAAVGVGRVADAMSLRAAFALLALLAVAPGLALSLLWHRADAQEAVTAGPQRVATVG